MNVQEIVRQLNSLDMQNPGGWPQWARIGATVLAALAVALAGLWFLVKPVYDELQTVRAEEITLRKEFEDKQAKVASLDAYREQLAEMERSFGAMLRQLPSRAEVANLLNDISQTRVASRLEEELFQPQSEVPRDFYAQIPNKIVVVGTYHEMGNFVSALAALPRIVTVNQIDMRPTGRSSGGDVVLRMNAMATTYRYLDDDELPKKKKPAPRRKR